MFVRLGLAWSTSMLRKGDKVHGKWGIHKPSVLNEKCTRFESHLRANAEYGIHNAILELCGPVVLYTIADSGRLPPPPQNIPRPPQMIEYVEARGASEEEVDGYMEDRNKRRRVV